jgi:hypothetical protein
MLDHLPLPPTEAPARGAQDGPHVEVVISRRFMVFVEDRLRPGSVATVADHTIGKRHCTSHVRSDDRR